MSIEGSISVSALFHDRDGTTAMKVVSLRSSTEYTEGQVAFITGTAGTAQTTIEIDNVYRNAAGDLVELGDTARIAFSWSAASARLLENVNDSGNVEILLRSQSGQVAACNIPNNPNLSLRPGSGTGTYTIVVYDNSQ